MSNDQELRNFFDLPEGVFPFTVELLDAQSREVFHTIEVKGAGSLHIPSCTEFGFESAAVRITWADGRVTYSEP